MKNQLSWEETEETIKITYWSLLTMKIHVEHKPLAIAVLLVTSIAVHFIAVNLRAGVA